MNPNEFRLYGFTAAKGLPPQFIEPIFSQGENLFIQSGISKDGTIVSFSEYDESVDLIEQQSEEVAKIGDLCIFAVMERGGRLIFGDRPYVSRYLSQNLRSYMDSPYFLRDCIEFTGIALPEFRIIENSHDLLELSVAVSSIRKFIKSSKRARSLIYIHFDDRKVLKEEVKLKETDSTAKTIFGEWIKFTKENNHPIATCKRWTKIEESFLKCYSTSQELPERYLLHHFDACRSIIVEPPVLSANLANLVSRYNEGQEPSDEADYRSSIIELQLLHRTPVSQARNQITSEFYELVHSALNAKTITLIEVLLQVYFLTVAVKEAFELENDTQKDD